MRINESRSVLALMVFLRSCPNHEFLLTQKKLDDIYPFEIHCEDDIETGGVRFKLVSIPGRTS